MHRQASCIAVTALYIRYILYRSAGTIQSLFLLHLSLLLLTNNKLLTLRNGM